MNLPVETFPALSALLGFRHAFLCRVPGLEVNVDREQALARLARVHEEAGEELGFGPLATARQVHGNNVVRVESRPGGAVPEADGLVTDVPGVCLGIYVADCCAIYLADPERRAIGLLHSGSKGTQLGIARAGVAKMREAFGSRRGSGGAAQPLYPAPALRTDFAAEIARQLREEGVGNVQDSGANTGADLDRYYSYRMEKGRTGRLLALLMIEPAPAAG